MNDRYVVAFFEERIYNTSLAAKGAPAHHLQNPKWPPGGPKIADGVWKGVFPQIFGHFKQLSQNKFFDPSTPSLLVSGRQGLERGVPLGFWAF